MWLWRFKEALVHSFTWLCPHVQKTRGFFGFEFYQLFYVFITFLSCHFVLKIFFLCGMERWQSHILSANRTCLLHRDLQRFQFSHLNQYQSMSYVNNFYVRSVSRVGSLPCDDEPIREVYHSKKRDQSPPPPHPPPPKKLINMNHSIYYKPNSAVPLVF
jgi:hypothetical protein